MQRKYINCYKNLAFWGKLMYKFERYRQLGPADFNQPVGFKMNPENRWVKKSETIPWDTIEEKYAKLFPSKTSPYGTWLSSDPETAWFFGPGTG